MLCIILVVTYLWLHLMLFKCSLSLSMPPTTQLRLAPAMIIICLVVTYLWLHLMFYMLMI